MSSLRDRRHDQHLEFPRLDPGWSVDETINHWNGALRTGASRRSTFVNCWYEEAEESEAMWKLFASQQYGIAVRTTATRLIGSFTEQLPDYFGRVSYIAYDSHLMPVTEFPPVFSSAAHSSTRARFVQWWHPSTASRRPRSTPARPASTTRTIRSG